MLVLAFPERVLSNVKMEANPTTVRRCDGQEDPDCSHSIRNTVNAVTTDFSIDFFSHSLPGHQSSTWSVLRTRCEVHPLKQSHVSDKFYFSYENRCHPLSLVFAIRAGRCVFLIEIKQITL